MKCDLLIHQKSHSGMKEYKCEQCNKAFTQKCDLNRPKKIHTGDKEFQFD